MSEKAEKIGWNFFLKMWNLYGKSSKILIQLFYSDFDLHGESFNIKSQNLYYIMEALCGGPPSLFQNQKLENRVSNNAESKYYTKYYVEI